MKKNWIRYILGFIGVLIIRLVPFRAPNIEPVLAAQMPFSKVFGVLPAFLFGSLSIIVYDLLTSGLGIWTIVTAVIYGLLGVVSFYFFKNRSGWKNYAIFAFIATIVYDAITGLTIGPIFFGQSIMAAAIGQIPFTAMHLLGNVSFAIVLSPVIEMWAVRRSKEVSVQVGVSLAS